MKRSFIFAAALAISVFLLRGCTQQDEGGSRTGNAADVLIAKGDIGPDGGTLTVERAGTPVDGVVFTLPAGAVADTTSFKLFWEANPLTPEYDSRCAQFSETIRIEPLVTDFAVPSTLVLPVAFGTVSTSRSPVAIGLGERDSVMEFEISSDSDYSDGTGGLFLFGTGRFAIGGLVVDSDASGLAITIPAASSGAHTVTQSSADPVQVDVNVIGRDVDGRPANLDSLLAAGLLANPLGGPAALPFALIVRFENTTTLGAVVERSDQTSQFVLAGEMLRFSTTASAFGPASGAGTVSIEAIVQEVLASPVLIGSCPFTSTACSPVLSLPADPFVVIP